MLGKSPDDPDNLVPTQQSLQAKSEQLKGDLDRFIERVNPQLPGSSSVFPWLMIPYSVWQGPHAGFLMVVCDRFPQSASNIFLMPSDDMSSVTLGMPKHPGDAPNELDETFNRFIGQVRDQFNVTHAKVAAELTEGNLSSLDESETARKQAAAEVHGLAHVITARLFGEEAYYRHRALFGGWLGWSTED